MRYCHTKTEFPTTPHFAALVSKSVTIPGDERSRTNPGHGYPEHREVSIDYISFTSREEMAEWVRQQESRTFGQKDYVIIEATPRRIVTNVSVE